MEAYILRILLASYSVVAFIISLFYLRYRRVSVGEYVFWGSVAGALPVLGPFFVLAARPGPRKRLGRSANKPPVR